MSTNFYEAIKPMLIVSKIFRITSYEFGEKGYKISKFNVYIQIILSLGYLVYYAFNVYNRKNVLVFSLLVTTTDILEVSVSTLLVVTTWLFSARYQKKSITILMRIISLDREMRKLGVWISYDKLNRMIYIQLVLRFVLVTVNIVHPIIEMLVGDFAHVDTFRFLFLFLSKFPITINTLICLEVSVYIIILKNRFEILNEHLTALQTNCSSLIGDDIKVIKLTTFLGTKLKMLRVVCPLHHELSKISEVVNERFGIVLLMSFLNTFVITVVSLYFCSTVWKNSFPNREYALTGSLLRCGTYIVETVFICYMCNTTVEEANKSGTLIHKIDTDDNDVKDQIGMFSLQIAHKRVEFSAAGLFPINYTLLFSIIGGVTTNLVILIQFSAT